MLQQLRARIKDTTSQLPLPPPPWRNRWAPGEAEKEPKTNLRVEVLACGPSWLRENHFFSFFFFLFVFKSLVLVAPFPLSFSWDGVADGAAGRTPAGWSGLDREAMSVWRRKKVLISPLLLLLLLSSRHQDGGTTSQSRVTRTKGEARPSVVNPFHTVNLVPRSAPCRRVFAEERARRDRTNFLLVSVESRPSDPSASLG